jgi:nucleoside-diphosphate-sugar epimerase
MRLLQRSEFDAESFRSALRGMDHVIYGIGLPEQFLFDDSVFEKTNCGMLRTFLSALQSSDVRRLTYISTYEVFEAIGGAIDETHPIADESDMTPYFQSMIRAYRIAVDFAQTNNISLTTIHPAAVYGGRNTGGGITDFVENLASRNWHRLPFISPSSFPVVHVDSLTDAILESLDKPGPYIVSDEMTSLRDIAQTMRKQTWSYIPLTVPLWFAMFGVYLLEAIARVIKVKPFASAVQIAFLTKGWMPSAARAVANLAWKPMPLEEGIRRFLSARRSAHADALASRPISPCERYGASSVYCETRAPYRRRTFPLLDFVLHCWCRATKPAFRIFRLPEYVHSCRSHSGCASCASCNLVASPRPDSSSARPRVVLDLFGGLTVPGRIGYQLQPSACCLLDSFLGHVPGGGDQHLVYGLWFLAGLRVRI